MKRQDRERGLDEEFARIGDVLGRQFRKRLEQRGQAATVVAGACAQRRDEMREVVLEFGPAVADDAVEWAAQAGMRAQPLAQHRDDVVQTALVEAEGLVEHKSHLWPLLPAIRRAERCDNVPPQAAGARLKSAGFSIRSARV
ncbi:hypothetical protein BO1005MUT1_390024 [Hyphomicrobiales bacterium]|nr:hypothetical protein BO1005MUT1_390024 [Hyphomicrobiales bacterium]